MLRNVEQVRSDMWEAEIQDSTGQWEHYFQYGETAAEVFAALRKRADSLASGQHYKPDPLVNVLADAARYGTGGD